MLPSESNSDINETVFDPSLKMEAVPDNDSASLQFSSHDSAIVFDENFGDVCSLQIDLSRRREILNDRIVIEKSKLAKSINRRSFISDFEKYDSSKDTLTSNLIESNYPIVRSLTENACYKSPLTPPPVCVRGVSVGSAFTPSNPHNYRQVSEVHRSKCAACAQKYLCTPNNLPSNQFITPKRESYNGPLRRMRLKEFISNSLIDPVLIENSFLDYLSNEELSSTITLERFCFLTRNFGLNYNAVFKLFDPLNHGRIDFREFCVAVYLCFNLDKNLVCGFMFSVFDLNHDFVLTEFELSRIVKSTNLISQSDARSLVREIYSPSDGIIDFDLFVKICNQHENLVFPFIDDIDDFKREKLGFGSSAVKLK